jgi:hypothetical protein
MGYVLPNRVGGGNFGSDPCIRRRVRADKHITLRSRRGEQLTRLLLAHYCTELEQICQLLLLEQDVGIFCGQGDHPIERLSGSLLNDL